MPVRRECGNRTRKKRARRARVNRAPRRAGLYYLKLPRDSIPCTGMHELSMAMSLIETVCDATRQARSLRKPARESHHMNKFLLSPPLLGFIIGTRAALGVGIGLLLAEQIPVDRRRSIAIALVAVGAATTIPAAIGLFGSRSDRALSA